MRRHPRTHASRNLRIAVVLAALFLSPPSAAVGAFWGKCVGITDGDTISVMRDDRAVKVRLEGIDCPERGQDFSSAAKKYTSALVFGKTVEVRQTSTDKYDRVLAVVYADGTNVNRTDRASDVSAVAPRKESLQARTKTENAQRPPGRGMMIFGLEAPRAKPVRSLLFFFLSL